MLLGPEMGAVLAGAPDPPTEETEDYALILTREFLDGIDPAALEVLALEKLGGLEGECSSVGEAFLITLRELLGGG